MPAPVTVDRLDRQILHGLQIAPRVPFARLAAVLEVSEQTVARRYQRLRTHGIVRVFGLVDHDRLPRTSQWFLRITCRPGAAMVTAEALARRPDTAWVTVSAGASELTCMARVTSDDEGLLHHLPRAANVLSLSAHQVLHRFVGRGEADWITAGDQLGAEQRRDLLTESDTSEILPATLESADKALLDALLVDGRASYSSLAEATGWSQRRVAARIAALSAAGLLRFDLDIAVLALGFRAAATLLFTVAPKDLAAVGARLADHRQLAWAAAMTGPAMLVATALCRDANELYHYLTTEVAAIPQVQNCESLPRFTRVKQAVSLVDGDVLRGPIG